MPFIPGLSRCSVLHTVDGYLPAFARVDRLLRKVIVKGGVERVGREGFLRDGVREKIDAVDPECCSCFPINLEGRAFRRHREILRFKRGVKVSCVTLVGENDRFALTIGIELPTASASQVIAIAGQVNQTCKPIFVELTGVVMDDVIDRGCIVRTDKRHGRCRTEVSTAAINVCLICGISPLNVVIRFERKMIVNQLEKCVCGTGRGAVSILLKFERTTVHVVNGQLFSLVLRMGRGVDETDVADVYR